MAGRQRKVGARGAVRRGHARTIAGLPRDVIETVGGGGGGTDTGITELTGDVTAGPGNGSQAATIANDAVTTAKIDDDAVTTDKIADGAITAAKIANVTSQRILARKTAGAGAPEEATISEILDFLGSAAHGDVLFRGAAGWELLVAPVSIGRVFQTSGPGADPVWGALTGSVQPVAFAHHVEYRANVNTAFNNNYGGAGTITSGSGVTAPPAAGSIFDDGYFIGSPTGAVTNSTSSWTSQSAAAGRELAFNWDFDLSFVIRTDVSAITSVRYMLGMGVNNENADTVTANYIGFRYSTAAGDGGWVGVTYDGTQSVTGTVAAIAANTRYVLRIRKVAGTVFFSVNGGAETATSTNVPTNNAYANIAMRVTALSNSARNLWLSRLWCDSGL